MVRPAFARASRQREQHTVSAVIAGRVVTGRGGQQLRSFIAVVKTYPGRRLADLLPSTAARERTASAVATNGKIDDPGAFHCQLFGTQAQLVHDTGAVALAEYVGISSKLLDRRDVFGLGEIQEATALAVA